MTAKPVHFRQIDPPVEAESDLSRGVQIVDTFGFEIVEQASTVPPANLDGGRATSQEHEGPLAFAATLRRIA